MGREQRQPRPASSAHSVASVKHAAQRSGDQRLLMPASHTPELRTLESQPASSWNDTRHWELSPRPTGHLSYLHSLLFQNIPGLNNAPPLFCAGRTGCVATSPLAQCLRMFQSLEVQRLLAASSHAWGTEPGEGRMATGLPRDVGYRVGMWPLSGTADGGPDNVGIERAPSSTCRA